MGSIVMKKLSNNLLLNVFIKLLFLMLFAKLISVGVLWFLPLTSHPVAKSEVGNLPYRYYDFHNLIVGETAKKSEPQTAKNREGIKSMILIGLYGNSKHGYAIVAMKNSPNNTEIISIGERYQGYKLKKIALNFVVFVKNNKEYILRLNETLSAKEIQKSVTAVESEDVTLSVSRSDINAYVKNPTQIWREISIQELKKNGKIVGFKVTKVQKNSKIARLGLQRGDIIIKANGVALTSYNEVIKIYQNLNKLDNISLLVKRGDEEKEIIYEIH
jgi:general secretion pathway protein C